MNPLFDGVEALTFDCYGTIVDWESGILQAARELLALGQATAAREGRGGHDGAAELISNEELLEMFGRLESKAERPPFRRYRAVLTEVATRMGKAVDRPVSEEAASRFAASVPKWPPFPDSRDALGRLAERYRLAIVSNVDDDLFRGTADRLGIDFDEIVTAQQVGRYKPEVEHFHEVLRRLKLPQDRIVHVAQSLYHDVAPAKALGFTCAWVDRRKGRSGPGATPPAEATPDLVVPDLAALAREAVG
ncbi:MAG: haloacid dehalogenase type II [Gemmatimonadetes bacterium]|nr:haloacid dehalogenase type II [Gemmatimonadota bacterium]NNL31403.1 haloacid dehalogenase type II [Gemmatimonadota bacterium]